MEGNNIDFEGGAGTQPAANAEPNPANQEDTTSLNGDTTEDVTGKSNENQGQDDDTSKPEDNINQVNDDENKQESSLEVGTQIEFDGNTYTVTENGDVVDSEGNVFKKAEDVQAWLDENNTVDTDENGELSIDAIREAVGIDVTDENGKPVDFDNTPAGVRSYVESVVALKSNEIQQGTINKLFNDNPLLKQFIDYVRITGTPRGFGDIPDRSGIQLDKDNPEQLKAVIRMAAKVILSIYKILVLYTMKLEINYKPLWVKTKLIVKKLNKELKQLVSKKQQRFKSIGQVLIMLSVIELLVVTNFLKVSLKILMVKRLLLLLMISITMLQ